MLGYAPLTGGAKMPEGYAAPLCSIFQQDGRASIRAISFLKFL